MTKIKNYKKITNSYEEINPKEELCAFPIFIKSDRNANIFCFGKSTTVDEIIEVLKHDRKDLAKQSLRLYNSGSNIPITEDTKIGTLAIGDSIEYYLWENYIS